MTMSKRSNNMAQRLAAARIKQTGVVSTEDGDVNVTIQQENEIETTDDLSAVEPGDQNANPDAFDPGAEEEETEKKLDSAINDVDQAADAANAEANEQLDEISTAVNGLESIQLLVNKIKDQNVAVSPIALEAIQLSINMATHRLPKQNIKVPSTESMTFGHRDAMQNLSTELSTLNKSLRAQHAGIKIAQYSTEASVIGWIGNKWNDMFINLFNSGHYTYIVREISNILLRYERKAALEYKAVGTNGAFISDPWTIWNLRGITGKTLQDAVARIHVVTNEVENFYKDRMKTIEKAADVAIDKLIEGMDFDITVREFQETLVNLSLYDGRDVKLTGSTMYQGLRRVFGKAFKPGGGTRVDGIQTDWSSERGVPVLNANAIIDVCKSTRDMINTITPIIGNEKNRRQEAAAMIRQKFEAAIKMSAESDLGPNIKVAKNLERAKEILEYVNGIEAIMLSSIRNNLVHLVHYIAASLTAMEYIRDPYKAVREAEEAARQEAEEVRIAMQEEYERELRKLKEELKKDRTESVEDDDGTTEPSRPSAGDFTFIITY